MNKHILLTCLTFFIWGLFPLYFKLVESVSFWEVLSHRIVWSFVVVSLTILLFKKKMLMNNWKVLQEEKKVHLPILAALLIGSNWLVFLIAVSTERVVETSLGYFVSPLLTMFLGIVIFKEKTSNYKLVAIVIATVGLVYKILMEGNLSWISISLAITFSAYGWVKKKMPIDSLASFWFEVVFLLLPALGYMIYLSGSRSFFFDHGSEIGIYLIGSGLVTATPLLLFHYAVKRTELTLFGFIQYLTPSVSFLLAVIVFEENFDINQKIVFGLIWTSIFLVCWESIKCRKIKKKVSKILD